MAVFFSNKLCDCIFRHVFGFFDFFLILAILLNIWLRLKNLIKVSVNTTQKIITNCRNKYSPVLCVHFFLTRRYSRTDQKNYRDILFEIFFARQSEIDKWSLQRGKLNAARIKNLSRVCTWFITHPCLFRYLYIYNVQCAK